MSAIRSTQTTVRSQRDTSTDRAQELRGLHRNPPSFLGSRQQSWRATAHRPAAVQAPSPCRDASQAPVGSGPEDSPVSLPCRRKRDRPKPIGSHSVMPASPLRLGMPSAWGRSRAPASAAPSPPRRRRARAWPQPRTEPRPSRPQPRTGWPGGTARRAPGRCRSVGMADSIARTVARGLVRNLRRSWTFGRRARLRALIPPANIQACFAAY